MAATAAVSRIAIGCGGSLLEKRVVASRQVRSACCARITSQIRANDQQQLTLYCSTAAAADAYHFGADIPVVGVLALDPVEGGAYLVDLSLHGGQAVRVLGHRTRPGEHNVQMRRFLPDDDETMERVKAANGADESGRWSG